ncbi:hypothetical protein [Sphingomonas sp. M1-B02]|uniref:hypothetical protein n=1 Tax=Sphingomonas sp. M1-B02 TaxID=3114300 RepID=UPI00223F31A1|nr:hypothetical protein [Sphingomonas sp. S6-11]UZK64627.1 hypothetical protein OKW87_08685 [Sphingomonas sp. S6-11]
MMHLGKAIVAALIVPLLLTACLFTPGKFQSTLDIRADRSFTFTYKGEVLAVDMKGLMGKAMAMGMSEAAKKSAGTDDADKEAGVPDLAPTPEEKAKRDADYRELAALIAKEGGYRQVEYRGDGLFYVDYAISGKLSHGFVFPFNPDAQMMLPFVTVELRGKDGVRVKAPGFAKQDTSGGLGAMGGLGSMGEGMSDGMGKAMGMNTDVKIDGTFVLTTNAEIVSQNEEAGAATAANGKSITWKVNARTKDAPMATLKVAGL